MAVDSLRRIIYGGNLRRLSFSKSKRLVSNKQFRDVLARGIRVSRGVLMLYMAENDCCCSRLGVSVSKSYGKAVERNRLKRLLREAFRQNQDKIPDGFDYLFMVSPEWLKQESVKNTAVRPESEQVESLLLALVAAAKSLLNKEDNH